MGVARRRRPNRVHHRRGLRQLSRLATTSTMASQKQETFEGIDFEEIKDVTSLETDEIKVLKICFNMFDTEDTMKAELKEAFRIYDKKADGFITTDQLREIIAELDQRLTKEDLDGIIEEIDEDGSGTMDFDEFCAMMMS